MGELRKHQDDLEPCPFLPSAEEVLRAAAMRELGADRGPLFYEQALKCAQSLWQQGFPAQSLLLVNRAFGAELKGGEAVLEAWPLPYAAAAWVMMHRRDAQFIGNPRRHFQHLATRMVEPRREQRAWRAWACWFLACRVFPDYPADEKQLAEEGVREPSREEIRGKLGELGVPGEAEVWEEAVALIVNR